MKNLLYALVALIIGGMVTLLVIAVMMALIVIKYLLVVLSAFFIIGFISWIVYNALMDKNQ